MKMVQGFMLGCHLKYSFTHGVFYYICNVFYYVLCRVRMWSTYQTWSLPGKCFSKVPFYFVVKMILGQG